MTKPLLKEEVAVEFHKFYNFDSQKIGTVGGGRTGLLIDKICQECGRPVPTPVQVIRADFKRGRVPRGKCKECYRDGIVNKDGYVWLLKPEHPRAYNGRYVPAHIWEIEQSLGRLLDTKNESVHHIDGDKSNNDISNLQLRTRFHGKGQKRVCGDCGSHNVVNADI